MHWRDLYIGTFEDFAEIQERARQAGRLICAIWWHTEADPPFDKDLLFVNSEGKIILSCSLLSAGAVRFRGGEPVLSSEHYMDP